MAEIQLKITPERKIRKQHSDVPKSFSNPFDSDSEDETSSSSINQPERQLSTPITSRESSRMTLNHPHNESDTRQTSPASSFLNSFSLAAKNIYKKKLDFSGLQKKICSNPFDSDSESDRNSNSTTSKQFSIPKSNNENLMVSHFGHDDTRQTSPASSFLNSVSLAAKNVYKEKFDFSGLQRKLSSNPYNNSDSEYDRNSSSIPSKRLSIPKSNKENFMPFGHDDIRVSVLASCSNSVASSEKAEIKKNYHDLGGLENENLQELDNYAVYKAEEATEKIKNCLKIAEEISESGAQTLATLEQQGEQITQTHLEAAKIEHDLSVGEKLLGSLGGLLSKPWIPRKTRTINGPLMMRYNLSKRSQQTDEREKLGFGQNHNVQSNIQSLSSNTSSPFNKIEVEKEKQDDALSDLSNLLGQIKNMAIDMGSELGRQNQALDHLHDDVDELNYRVQGANLRGRRLLGK